MTEENQQPDWSQLAELRPRLQRHMNTFSQVYRGDRWYVLHDASNATHLRFNGPAYECIGRFDGELTLDEIWKIVSKKLGDDAPTQTEIIMILAQLFSIGAIRGGISVNAKEFLKKFQGSHNLRKKLNPLAIRVPLFDPDQLLNRIVMFFRPMFSVTGFVIWSVIVGFASLLALINFSSLAAAVNDDLFSTNNLISMVILYSCVKLIHEFGHALAVKVWGGEVHEMGFTLLVMVPIPHVDATAAWAFQDKHKRVIVGAAGILAELLLASIALFVWLAVEPGVIKDIALNVILIGSLSTLLFNANPLLRFDGYYILQDLIEIPNLSTRSSRFYLYLIQRYLFGIDQARSPQTADGEEIWFAFYGLAATCYRLVILLAITLFLIEEYLVVGVALGTWAIATQVLLPISRGILFSFSGIPVAEHRKRARMVTVGFAVATFLVLGFVPVSLTTRADGVVWVPDQAQVFADTDGFVEQLIVSSGDTVESGDVLVQMRNPELSARIAVLEAKKRELVLIGNSEWFGKRVQSQITKTELEFVEAELTSLSEQADSLQIRSGTSGTVVLPGESEIKGLYLEQGQMLGYVTSQDRLIVRSVVSQTDIGLVRRNVGSVQVRLAENPTETVEAQIIRETPAASSELPSAALSTAGGGTIALSQTSSNTNANIAAEKLFRVDLELPEGINITGLGERAYIRFDHGSEPLAIQWARLGRQLILSRLSL